MRLTWADLLIDGITPDDFGRWLLPWSPVLGGRVAPAFMSKFGTWFLRRPEGHVEMLDVFTGEVSRVPDTYDAFLAEVNGHSWQEVYLLSELVLRLHTGGQGRRPGPVLCAGPAPGARGSEPVGRRPSRYPIRDAHGHRRVAATLCRVGARP